MLLFAWALLTLTLFIHYALLPVPMVVYPFYFPGVQALGKLEEAIEATSGALHISQSMDLLSMFNGSPCWACLNLNLGASNTFLAVVV